VSTNLWNVCPILRDSLIAFDLFLFYLVLFSILQALSWHPWTPCSILLIYFSQLFLFVLLVSLFTIALILLHLVWSASVLVCRKCESDLFFSALTWVMFWFQLRKPLILCFFLHVPNTSVCNPNYWAFKFSPFWINIVTCYVTGVRCLQVILTPTFRVSGYPRQVIEVDASLDDHALFSSVTNSYNAYNSYTTRYL
jgi:hypothetical protein